MAHSPSTTRRRVLVITGDRLSTSMAGPAIRAWHIATELAAEHEVRLVSGDPIDITSELFELHTAPVLNSRAIDEHLEWAELVLFQGHALGQYAAMQRTDRIMICDIYDPMHLEQLEQARDLGPEKWRDHVFAATDLLNQQLRRGDFFVCASERQRFFWLGQLAALGRINPDNYERDASLSALIDLAPFGLVDEVPAQTRHAIKGAVPGIGPDDKVVIWAGGVYNWFDPVSLVRAVAELATRRPDVRLFFLGMKHPNPNTPEMRAAYLARQLAEELGLVGRHVFFNEGWVAYADRHNYLLDADCGVSTHFDHLETTFSFRTRILDYLWARLPIVTTGGDSFGDLVAAEHLGVTVPPLDVEALAAALERVLYDADYRAAVATRLEVVRARFTWPTVLRPVLEFCRDPKPAADRHLALTAGGTGRLAAPPSRSIRGDVALVRSYLAAGGPRELISRVLGRVRRLVGLGPRA